MPLFHSQFVGQVEILEDDKPWQNIDAPTPQAEEKNAARALLLHEANAGLQGTKTILDTAAHSHHVAVATASSLSAQTRQLEGITEDLDVIDGTVDRAGNTVYKLTRNPLRALVEKPLTHSKKKRNQNHVNPALISAEEDSRGIRSKSDKSESDPSSSWLARRKEELIPRISKKGHRSEKRTVEVMEDHYSDFDDDVKQILRKQDDHLDQTANQLTELRNLALGINAELGKQAEMVESIDAPKITGKLRYNNAKLKRKFRI
ncbi:unnamed protein product [Agarophyton chilense]